MRAYLLPVLVILALLIIVIVGFSTSAGMSSKTLSRTTSRPIITGPHILQWGLVGVPDVQTLDPLLASDPTSISVASLVYGGLVRLDAHLRVVPDGASSWTISRDGKVYTFVIRPNLKFPDGRRVVARDFAVALNRALGPEGAAGSASFYLGLIAHRSAIDRGGTRTKRGIEALNSTTLRITLVHPAAHFLSELAFPVSFVPDASLFNRYGQTWTNHAAGFGPFFVEQWQHTRFLRLGRNPHYYGGMPALRGIVLHFYGSGGALAAYTHGSLDLVSGMEPGRAPSGKPPGLRRVPGLALNYLAFNAARLPFLRLNARRAFASIWSPGFATAAMGSASFPARGVLPSAFGLTTSPWRPTSSSMSYLAAARYPRARGFPQVTLVMPRDSRLLVLARELRQAWKTRLGIVVSLRQLNTSNYSKVLSARAFDLALVEWGADYPDPQNFLGTQLGSTTDNVTGWSRKAYERAVTLADTYSPLDLRRAALFRSAADLVARKVPILPLYEPAQTALIQPRLVGIALTPLGTIYGDWVHVRLKK